MAVTIEQIGATMSETWGADPNKLPIVAKYAYYSAFALGYLFCIVCILLVVFEIRKRVLMKRQQTSETLAGIANTKAFLKFLYPAVLFLLIIVITLFIIWYFSRDPNIDTYYYT